MQRRTKTKADALHFRHYREPLVRGRGVLCTVEVASIDISIALHANQYCHERRDGKR
jgi:hypothetical protein